ncbi:MAG: EAL domain-containing protein [Candidatus Nanopelagicales bacterium]
MAQALYSLDSPRPLSGRSRLWMPAILIAYAGVVAISYALGPDPLSAIPAIAVTHALMASLVAGITALLMYSHAHSTGRRGYLMIAGTFAYLSGILLFFPMYYPGGIFEGPSVWGGIQSALSLYFAWHFAFPIGLGASAMLIYFDQQRHRRPGLTRRQRVVGVALPAVGVLITLAAVSNTNLVAIVNADDTKTNYAGVLDALVVAVSLACVVVTFYCARNGSMIGRWLAALALFVLGESIVNLNAPHRYTFGWYSSRLLWLFAVGGLLVALIWNLSRIDRANSELASADSLTGSESRMSLLETLRREIARVRAVNGQIALLWIDIDGFKGVNDQLGHPAGDDVLRQIVRRLSEHVRHGDHVGRLGGDEFGVLLCDDVTAERANLVAERLLNGIRDPMLVGDNEIHVSAAIGIALAPKHATGADDLLMCADLAMYAAKNRGGDRYEQYDEAIAQEAVGKARLHHDLAKSLRDGDFCLYYQPIFEADGMRMAGVEALVRWMRDGVAVPAGDFVPFAEQSGQIVSLGRTVLGQLARELPLWLTRVDQDFFVCVNLSVKELADDPLIEEVLTGGLRHSPRQFVVEVTESLELQENSDAERNLERLRAAGVRIAIDDFGAGFSNFTRLERLQPSLLKIDRSLVRRAGSEQEGGVAFLSAATSVAASLNCEVVAEGVETITEAQVVELLGVRYLQGFRYGEPLPIEAFLASVGVPWAAHG